jgi:phenylacetate-CoA ligase
MVNGEQEMHPWAVRRIIYPLYEWGTGRDILRKWRELEKSQWLSAEELRVRQWEKVQAILQHAYTSVPFYRQKFAQAGITPADIQTPADMAQIPPLTKQELRQRREDMMATTAVKSQLHRNATGGSTGEPTIFYNDQLDLDYRSAAVLRNYRWAGLEVGEPHLMLWGSAFDLSRYASWKGRLTNSALNRYVLPAFELSTTHIDQYLAELRRLKPRVIIGYSSVLLLIARYINEKGISFNMPALRSIISTAETLSDEQRLLLGQAFRAEIFDRYGSREFGCIAHECEAHQRHVNGENIYLEVVQNGRLAPPGQYGELAITSLNNYGFPFIRYLIGDAGRMATAACSCGRGLPLLDELLGRVHDILVTPDGRFLPGEFFPHLFKELESVERFQVVQKRPDHLLVRIQVTDQYRPQDSDFLLDKIRQAMGERVQIDIEQVAEIPTLPSGKLRFTISEVDIDFNTWP